MKGNKLKLITKILAILTICLISFVGIYVKSTNKMQNKVKDYEFSKDLDGYRELIFKVSDATEVLNSEGKVIGNTDEYTDSTIEKNSYQKSENKINVESDLTSENYQKAKKVIETRLKSLGIEDYELALNLEDGTMHLKIPEDSNTNHTVSNILQVAKFEIRDSNDASNVLITNDDIKKISTVYNTTSSGTTVYLQIEFNKDGKNILKQISNGEYKTNTENSSNSAENENSTSDGENTSEENTNTSSETENNDENSSSEENTTSQKKITLAIDNNEMITTSFDDPIEDGIIDLSMNKATTDNSSITETLQSASTIAAVVNSGKMPLTYKITENSYIKTDISKENLQKAMYVIAVIVAIALIYLIFKKKLSGLMAAISYVGFVAIELLVIRYTNVMISLESIVAGCVILAINYMITYTLLKINETDVELKNKAYKGAFKSIIMKTIPIFIISIVFVFIRWTKISTFGMTMFWGLFLSIIYNYVVTKNMLEK